MVLYPKYKFSMKSYYMNVSTTAKNAEIYVNDKKEVELSNDKTSKEIDIFSGFLRCKGKSKVRVN